MTQRTRRTVDSLHRSARWPWPPRRPPSSPPRKSSSIYNASLNHYFVTAFPEEAAMLDAGTTSRAGRARG